MRFLPHRSDDGRPFPADPKARAALFAMAALAMVAAMRPWIRVRFPRLFGELDGPPAWQSTAGFTCLCASALVAVLALLETDTAHARRSVRPASGFLAGIAALIVLAHALGGPGTWRGVSARWTAMFWLGLLATPALAAVCAWRWHRGRGRRQSSSGPPT